MSWKTDNSIKRIFNTFKRLKTQIFNQDIEALKLLNETIAEQEKKYVNDNLLYAKLLCYVLDRNFHHYGDMKMAIKVSHDILKEPLHFHLQMLHRNINDQDFNNYLKSIGIEFDTYKNQNDILKANEKEFVEKLKNNWTYENVSKAFYNTANDFLKETENYI